MLLPPPVMNLEAALKTLDNPIEYFEEDVLKRRSYVENICRILQTPTLRESNVFSINGEWGSGKTSVKNLILRQFSEIENRPIIVDFNPWAFSGQDQVLEAFFSEVAKGIGRGGGNTLVQKLFARLGAYLSYGSKLAQAVAAGFAAIDPTLATGLIVQGAATSLASGAKAADSYAKDLKEIAKTSLPELQEQLKVALGKLDRQILIVIDDIDRLTPDHLLLIFQIVKINAGLPGVNYLLLMDRFSVEKTLATRQFEPNYIEKIVQFEFTLPHIPRREYRRIVREATKIYLGAHIDDNGWKRWDLLWTLGLQRIFTTLRRIKRFFHLLRFYVRVFENNETFEINAVDLLTLEAIRFLSPVGYAAIATHCDFVDEDATEILRMQTMAGIWDEKPFGHDALAAIERACGKEHWAIVEPLLKELFPQLGEERPQFDREDWLREARVCHSLFFRPYFSLLLPENQLNQHEIRLLMESLDEPAMLEKRVREGCTKAGLTEVIRRLQSRLAQIDPKNVGHLLTILWDEDERRARESAGEDTFSGRHDVQAFTESLLEDRIAEGPRADILADAFARSEALYPLAYLARKSADLAGDERRRAVSQADYEKLKPLLLARFRAWADDGTLVKAPTLGSLVYLWKQLEPEQVREWFRKECQNPERVVRMLEALLWRGSEGTEITYGLRRDALEDIYPNFEELDEILGAVEKEKLTATERKAVEETLRFVKIKKSPTPANLGTASGAFQD
jgi:hypothetical protein